MLQTSIIPHNNIKKSVALKPRQLFSSVIIKISSEKEKIVSHIGTWVVDQLARSNQAQKQLSAIPLSIIATFLKGVISFLILYRLATGNRIIDVLISILITILTACVSPMFYVLVQQKEDDILKFTNHISDRIMSHGGLEYALQLRNRSILVISFFAILFLLCFEVDSRYLIQCILEYLVSFWVVDQVNQFREKLYTPIIIEWHEEFYACEMPKQLTKYDFTKVNVPRAQQAKIIKPKRRARVISRKTLDKVGGKQKKVAGSNLVIIDDWERK